jgi:hypothetical protein
MKNNRKRLSAINGIKKFQHNKCETTCAKRFSALYLILDTKNFSVN